MTTLVSSTSRPPYREPTDVQENPHFRQGHVEGFDHADGCLRVGVDPDSVVLVAMDAGRAIGAAATDEVAFRRAGEAVGMWQALSQHYAVYGTRAVNAHDADLQAQFTAKLHDAAGAQLDDAEISRVHTPEFVTAAKSAHALVDGAHSLAVLRAEARHHRMKAQVCAANGQHADAAVWFGRAEGVLQAVQDRLDSD